MLSKLNKFKLKQKILPYIYLLPTIIVMGIVVLYPLMRGIYNSFLHYRLIMPDNIYFIGLENFQRLLKDNTFQISFINSIIWTASIVFFSFLIGFIAALLLNEEFWGRSIFRGLILIPWIIPFVVAGLTWRWIFQDQYGVFNYLLRSIGLISRNISWLGNPNYALPAVIIAGIWKAIPFVTIVLLAGLQNIPQELYESAMIDGANIIKRFRHITLPLMKPVIMVVLILTTIWNFNQFDLVYVMTRGGPADSTMLLPIYTHLNAFSYFNIGYGSAIGTIMLLILLFISILYIKALGKSKYN